MGCINQTRCSGNEAAGAWAYLVFVNVVALPFIIELLVEALFFDHVANVDMF